MPNGPAEEAERTTTVVEGLKDLAIDTSVPVLAIVAADKAGLDAGKRMRVNHLRGSSALAYEADIVLILNNKFDIVASHHLIYDLGNVERFRDWAVLTVEKNRVRPRRGRAGVPQAVRPGAFRHRRQGRDRATRGRAGLPRVGRVCQFHGRQNLALDPKSANATDPAVGVGGAQPVVGSGLCLVLDRDVTSAVGVDLDTGAHGGGDGDLADVAALGAGRLEPEHFVERGGVVLRPARPRRTRPCR